MLFIKRGSKLRLFSLLTAGCMRSVPHRACSLPMPPFVLVHDRQLPTCSMLVHNTTRHRRRLFFLLPCPAPSQVLERPAFTCSMLEKLIWICAFMLVGARHGGCTVGEVEAQVG